MPCVDVLQEMNGVHFGKLLLLVKTGCPALVKVRTCLYHLPMPLAEQGRSWNTAEKGML